MDDKNLDLWQKYGNNALIIMPFLDNIIVKTEGTYIIDANGKKILDFASGAFCSLLGHNNPKLIERLKKQMDIAVHTGVAYISTSFFEAASKLAGILPGNLDRVMFLSTGTEANEAAVKIAKEYAGKSGLMGFDKGHLGSSLLMKQLSIFNPAMPSCRPKIKNIYKIITPACYKCPVKARYPECKFLCIKISEKRLKFHLNKMAAMIAEPIISEAGIVVPPPGYFKRLKETLDRYKILLIVDEAQTAFGRTGKWFAIEHHDVVPEILVASKTSGSGYPVSIVATNSKIEEKLISEKFIHATSHINDPLGAEAVSAVVDIINEENLIKGAEEKGIYIFNMLNELKKEFPGLIKDIRGKALMIGIEINNYNGEKARGIGQRLAYTLIENGLNINWFSPNVLILEPPLTLTYEECKEGVSILRESIQEILNDRQKNSGIIRKNSRSSLLESEIEQEETFLQRVVKKITLK